MKRALGIIALVSLMWWALAAYLVREALRWRGPKWRA